MQTRGGILFIFMKPVTISKLIVITSIFVLLFGNMAFITNVIEVYPANFKNSFFLLSLACVFGGLTSLLLSLVCFKYTVKPILILVLLMSAPAAYFMDTYNVVIDDVMINNILNTDMNESRDLLGVYQLLYILFLGVLPSIYVYKAKIRFQHLKIALASRALLIVFSLILLLLPIYLLSDFYASFFREHKLLRQYANPSYYLYSAIKFSGSSFGSISKTLPFKVIAPDAKIPTSDIDRELVILVVGETARADHFSLNGYDKLTNPYLEKQAVVSFNNVWSCGTSTSVSVPCMFSIYDQSNYDGVKADSTENILDVLKRSSANVLWLDNNSSSKGVADRIDYESYKSSDKNSVCDIECRDIGMLKGIQPYIEQHPKGDIIIVLHQIGNHGPAYYKRYPKSFRQFLPTCNTNQLQSCNATQINNTYDNAILYTDYFLSEVIQLLKVNDKTFETAMVYISDHGESLGESNIYLHGMPYRFAPDNQKHVPLIMWFGESFKPEINFESLKSNTNKKYSHANLFHTLLGLMEVETKVYDKEMDIIEHYPE
jgi:lipid A ethanolaminephosphotransferase